MSIKKISDPYDGEWHPWFAWYSVDTACGHRVWWEHIERRWDHNANVRCIDPYDPGLPDGGWEYRLPVVESADQEQAA